MPPENEGPGWLGQMLRNMWSGPQPAPTPPVGDRLQATPWSPLHMVPLGVRQALRGGPVGGIASLLDWLATQAADPSLASPAAPLGAGAKALGAFDDVQRLKNSLWQISTDELVRMERVQRNLRGRVSGDAAKRAEVAQGVIELELFERAGREDPRAMQVLADRAGKGDMGEVLEGLHWSAYDAGDPLLPNRNTFIDDRLRELHELTKTIGRR